MKIGISTVCLADCRETEDALSILKELGADVCEVYLKTFYEYRPEFAQKYAERAAGLVDVVHANPQNFEGQLFSPSRRVRGDGFYWLDQVLRSAQLFGAKNYVFHGFARTGAEGGIDAWVWYLAEAANFCARYGVNLCLENVGFGLYNEPLVFKELKARCPQISGVFDMSKARLSGYPYQMYLKDMAGAVAAAHLADFDESGKPCLPGEGGVDFKEVLSRLKEAGFDGAAVIDAPCFGDLEALKRAVGFLKETADKI